MAISALIQFTQGALTPAAGQALIGVEGAVVTAANANNKDVERWEWSWRAVDDDSALVVGLIATGQTPTITFTPDASGTYVLVLNVYDRDGNIATDVRCFSVLEDNGLLIPNFDADADSMNFGGEKFGWHPYMRAWMKQNKRLRTTDNALHTIATIALPNNSMSILDVETVAIKSGHAIGMWLKTSLGFLNNNGTVTKGTQKDVDSEQIGGAPTWVVTLDKSTTNAIIQVNSAGDDVTWRSKYAFSSIVPLA